MSDTKKQSERLTMISFRADDEIFEALKALEAAVAEGVVTKRRRSIAIRKALLEAFERISRRSKKM